MNHSEIEQMLDREALDRVLKRMEIEHLEDDVTVIHLLKRP
jgi:hypothetical protein